MPTVTPVNFEELRQAFSDAPKETAQFVKGELGRFAKRVRRQTFRTGMSGRPGIDGGQFKRGKHVQGFVIGSDLGSLKAVNKISRILRVHEEGGTITPKQGGFLFLSKKTNVAGKGHIFARVKQVLIPARLHFQDTWRSQVPDGEQRISSAMERAMRVAMERRMKTLTNTVSTLTSL
jgi:hypothetical protein